MVGFIPAEHGAVLRLHGGGNLQIRKVVLALGNFSPGNPPVADGAFYESPRYYAYPWADEVLPDLLDTKSCLLIGSGLTMVDWVVSLNQAGIAAPSMCFPAAACGPRLTVR